MSVINTNITSMIGQSNLSKSQSALQTSMERLSSGLRINSAKDDAAGQAIANRMTAQITGLAQAQRNANDGISVAQTAEGALNQINDNVQRIRELTVQASNGTNSTDDLKSIQDEIDQRTQEIDRISRETNFNGVNVLAKNQTMSIQVGANDGEAINVGLRHINTETLGLTSLDVQSLPSVVDAGGFPGADEAAAAADATFNFADENDEGGLENLTVLQSGDAYFVRDEAGNFYTATITEPDDGDATVEVKFNSETALTDENAATAGLTPLADIDAALKNIDELRSELGAVQNRFEDAITNLDTNETNLAAARSRIEDADYAVEVANMTRAQILQQAGTSVLAQANQIPQNVLSLLG